MTPSICITVPLANRKQINELKKSWSQDHDQQSYQDIHSSLSFTIDGSGLLFSQVKPMERIEIISSLPPKWEVDRLISTFFNYDDFPINLPRKTIAVAKTEGISIDN